MNSDQLLNMLDRQEEDRINNIRQQERQQIVELLEKEKSKLEHLNYEDHPHDWAIQLKIDELITKIKELD